MLRTGGRCSRPSRVLSSRSRKWVGCITTMNEGLRDRREVDFREGQGSTKPKCSPGKREPRAARCTRKRSQSTSITSTLVESQLVQALYCDVRRTERIPGSHTRFFTNELCFPAGRCGRETRRAGPGRPRSARGDFRAGPWHTLGRLRNSARRRNRRSPPLRPGCCKA